MASMSCVSQAVPFTSRTIFASHLSLSAPSPFPNFMCDNNTGLLLQISKILSNARNGHDGLFFFDHYCRTEQSSLHYEISLQCIFSFLHIDSTWCHIITITAKIVCTRKLDAAWKKQKQKHFDSFTLLFFCSIHINLSMKCKKAANPHRETEEELINYQHWSANQLIDLSFEHNSFWYRLKIRFSNDVLD